jgi:SAM-dependent methyltransferase
MPSIDPLIAEKYIESKLNRLNEALAEIYRVLKPGGLYFASTFFIGDLKKVPTGGGFSTFESVEELNGYVTKAGFSSSGGATVVRKEGRGCAIIKAMKSPIPEKGSPGMLSELFNDTFKTSSGETGESRLTIMEAAAIATTQAIETVTAAAESAAETVAETVAEALAPPAEDTTDDALPPSPAN